MGLRQIPASSISRMTCFATFSCSVECVKIAERYCVPSSAPCRFSVVGSWTEKKIRQMSAGIPDLDLLDPAEVLEDRLKAPETSTGDGRDLSIRIRIGHRGPRWMIRPRFR